MFFYKIEQSSHLKEIGPKSKLALRVERSDPAYSPYLVPTFEMPAYAKTIPESWQAF
jgi:hypothetical protein